MNIFRHVVAIPSLPGNLLDEIGTTTLTLDTVYGLYGLVALGALGLWGLGVLVLGKGAQRASSPAPRTSLV